MCPGTGEAGLKVTRMGSALCAEEMDCRGRRVSGFKGQLGARHRPGEDAEMHWAPGGGAGERAPALASVQLTVFAGDFSLPHFDLFTRNQACKEQAEVTEFVACTQPA